MEPQIQYGTAADGVRIAYWTLGEGPLFMQLPLVPFSHLQLEWQIPEYRQWYERLAQTRRLIRYDCRGAGLSDRDVADYSLEAYVADIEAVHARIGFEQFDLLAGLNAGPIAIAYAAHHPERVSHLILWCTYDRASDFFGPGIQAAQKLIDIDWELYTETVAHSLVVGWAEGDLAHRIAAYLRECLTWETAKRVVWLVGEFDVSELVPLVRSPTLVFHRRQLSFLDVASARRLVARLPEARLALVEGSSLVPLGESMGEVLQTIDEFVGASAAPPTPASRNAGERLGSLTILFTDVAGSTELTRRLGDSRAREVLRTHEGIVREELATYGGAEIKTMGDGFLASFASATRALECAITLQRRFAVYNTTCAEAVQVRIGLNAGEPIAERDDLFGTAVQLAARICAHAAPGQILVSNVVRELAAGKSMAFRDCGGVSLRGFDEPVRLFEVAWQA